MINVLVTGVGAIIGYGIIGSLRQIKNKDIRIIGMDIYDDAYGKFICDSFHKAVLAYSDEYPSFIRELVANEKIDLIIPGIEQDMYRLNEIKSEIPTKIVLNNDLLIDISKDKLNTFNFFKDKGINLIPTLYLKDFDTYKQELGIPFLLKPRSSYASKGIHKIHNKEEFDYYNLSPENYIFQRIVGSDTDEYTVSVFGDGSGGFDDMIMMKRKLAQTGATDKAEVILLDNEIEPYVKLIASLTKPLGPTNIQLRKENGLVYLLEINPRISSACSIRTAAGYNEPEKCIALYLEGKHLPSEEKRPIHSIRYIADYIYE